MCIRDSIKVCQAQLDLRTAFEEAHGKVEAQSYETNLPVPAIIDRVREVIQEKLEAHVRAPYEKKNFYGGLNTLEDEAVEAIVSGTENPEDLKSEARAAARVVSREVMREMVLAGQGRIDGRDPQSVRPIWLSLIHI